MVSWLADLGFNIPSKAKVIYRPDFGLDSHLIYLIWGVFVIILGELESKHIFGRSGGARTNCLREMKKSNAEIKVLFLGSREHRPPVVSSFLLSGIINYDV